MNLIEIFNNSLKVEDKDTVKIDNIITEGFFGISPLVAVFTLKNDAINALNNNVVVKKTNEINDKIGKGIGNIKADEEAIKAEMGLNSGKGDDATVYKLTKEQKKFLYYIFKKYGNEVSKDIINFRNRVVAPYQIIKRNVSNNKSLTDKDVHGITKANYDLARESGRKKILKMGDFYKDSKNINSEYSKSRKEYYELEKYFDDLKAGKVTNINSEKVQDLLTSIHLGTGDLKNWSLDELSRTYNKIEELKKIINNGVVGENGKIRIHGKGYNAEYSSKEELESQINFLKKNGISAFKNGTKERNDNLKNKIRKGNFEEAYKIYIERKNTIDSLTKDPEFFKKEYMNIIKKDLISAKQKNDVKFNNLKDISKNYELNDIEKKIWGLKATGVKNSGKLSDWYLKIKPEDFKGTKYFAKSQKVIDAEKTVDRLLKEFQRKLEKIITPEDMKLIKKYRLINNLFTVKELKNSNDLFKDKEDLYVFDKESNETPEDIEKELGDLKYKNFNTIKELETAQNEIKNKVNSLSSKEKDKIKDSLKNFLSRTDPVSDKTDTTRSEKSDLNNLVIKLNEYADKKYTNVQTAEDDLNELNNLISDFKEKYPDSEKIEYIKNSIEKSKANIELFLSKQEE